MNMIASRLISFFFFFVAFGIVAATPTPNADTSLAKRANNTAILDVLQTLKGQTDTILPQITEIADSDSQTEDNLTPLFDQLTGAINQATADLANIPASERRALAGRQSDDELAQLVAELLTDITGALDGLLDNLSGLPFLGGLFGGLDAALNQLLKGLEGLLAGLLNLVARLLDNVADLLRRLAFGLTLGALGL